MIPLMYFCLFAKNVISVGLVQSYSYMGKLYKWNLQLPSTKYLLASCKCYTLLWKQCCLQNTPWWRHQMEAFSGSLSICAGNSPVTGEFPSPSDVELFDDFFDLCLNKRLSKQLLWYWFETPSRPLWCHCSAITMTLWVSFIAVCEPTL